MKQHKQIDLFTHPRPFIKWSGGKGQLISKLIPLLPQGGFNRYHEPFLGGGALFFAYLPINATLTDINSDLINTWNMVKFNPSAVLDWLKYHSENHDKEHYYWMRSLKVDDLSTVERAARFIYLNRTCFNGLYRENSKGVFNVPMGNYKTPLIYNPDLIYAVSKSLQKIDIFCEDYQTASDRVLPGDFVYFDPPYDKLNTTSFTKYNKNDFSKGDQLELCKTFQTLVNKRVNVMLSNSDTPFIRELYHGFHIHEVQANRSINSKGNGRGKVAELIITSYLNSE